MNRPVPFARWWSVMAALTAAALTSVAVAAADDPPAAAAASGPASNGASPGGGSAAMGPLSGAGHWAYQTVKTQVVPDVRNKKWVRSPIDAFVLAKLEANKLEPSVDADRASFIRRATLDVWG